MPFGLLRLLDAEQRIYHPCDHTVAARSLFLIECVATGCPFSPAWRNTPRKHPSKCISMSVTGMRSSPGHPFFYPSKSTVPRRKQGTRDIECSPVPYRSRCQPMSILQNIMRSSPGHSLFALSVSRWEQGTRDIKFPVLLIMPAYKLLYGTSAISIHRHRPGDFTALHD